MLHERLRCYKMALELAKDVAGESKKWAFGYAYLNDQMKRALASVILNCAEGNARMSQKERKRFFQIARSSLTEVSSCVDLLLAFNLIIPEMGKNWKVKLDDISKMLFALK